MTDQPHKACTGCSAVLPLTSFYYEKRLGRHQARCKTCVCAYQASHRLAHPPKRQPYAFCSYAAKSPEAKAIAYAGVKAWRLRNAARFTAEAKASLQLRRSLAYGAAWPSIVAHYGSACLSCGATGGLCFDHVVPLSAGGANALVNGQPLCRACNTFKGRCPVPNKDYRPDGGAWIASLVALNPWLGEPFPAGRWHLKAGGRERLARLQALASAPLVIPV